MKFIIIYLALLAVTIISFTYYILNTYYSTFYSKGQRVGDVDTSRATIVIPVFREDVEVFRKVIVSIKLQGAPFIVVGDSSLEPYKTIVEENGGRFIYLSERGGKKNALVQGLKEVHTEYVMFVDSDTLIPADTLKSMLSYFAQGIAGVGVNIHIKNDGTSVAYASEFIERLTEMISKSMSRRGNVYVLDGRCAAYKTDVIKPFMLSDDFLNKKLFGRKVMLGDDMLLTSYLIKNKYKMVKDYDITVETEPQQGFKKFLNQQIRWSRRGWYFFFKNMSDGTAKNGGKFYTFEMLYIYLIPIIGFTLFIFRAMFFLHIMGHLDYLSITSVSHFVMYRFFHYHPRHFMAFLINGIMYGLGAVGDVIFVGAIALNIPKERLRTLGYGAMGLGILFFVNLYGLATFWKQSGWLTR
ncbi:MAG: glycosyltransferase [Ferroplasma sp.]|uniref:glycosyltransferase n=1 Tax=Ferroplasma sp. TaxID=2591003 RepID=UPI002814E5C4|nr:glycosyltransferase [Ferroplasma sp.]WMT50809.1 MAG: glycosyltransferase [Ferroplasma sp.]